MPFTVKSAKEDGETFCVEALGESPHSSHLILTATLGRKAQPGVGSQDVMSPVQCRQTSI